MAAIATNGFDNRRRRSVRASDQPRSRIRSASSRVRSVRRAKPGRLECWPVFDRKILAMRYHEFKWRQGCGGRLSRLDGDVFRHRRDCRPNPNGCRQHDDGDARTSYFAHDSRSSDGEICQLPDVHDAHYRLRAVAFSCKARSSRSIAVCQRCSTFDLIPSRAGRLRVRLSKCVSGAIILALSMRAETLSRNDVCSCRVGDGLSQTSKMPVATNVVAAAVATDIDMFSLPFIRRVRPQH